MPGLVRFLHGAARRDFFMRLLLLFASYGMLYPETPGKPDPSASVPGLTEQIAQMLILGFRGAELTRDNPVYADVAERKIGGLILYDLPGYNIVSPGQLLKLTGDLQELSPQKLFIAIDQEGGAVNRLKADRGFPETISAGELGRIDDTDLTAFFAGRTAETLKHLGINLNFAPCVDLNARESNPVIGKLGRSFSAGPEEVLRHAEIWIAEHSKQGILSCPKHFPGHGSSAADTHYGFVDVTDTWDQAELVPYRELIRSNAVKLIMVSHLFNRNLDPFFPATLSHLTLSGLLRQDLGFEGLIVADDLTMGAIIGRYRMDEAFELAINAGVDLFCLANTHYYDPHLAERAINTIHALVMSGRVSRERIEESWRRITALKAEF
jgi:beta-N-acetylhexosaminidase